ncbi:Hsp20/alpha crystallin family protein [Halorubrum sp. PV6]|uniref:Hsp20/alpha crystallin family protein n=1 Tax=Halorubrum sp. PV6 TaxID=634157 RepID=UPI000F854563|nr:Hsp20/alpha crystallin family protein [Halorubrum sp. PV6]AZQ13634.1 Hsp20/alpha crystallin family protein [Halorubrum sp. PV6]
MTRRDPFTEIEDLLERMGREFEELGGTLDTPGGGVPRLPGAGGVPVDVFEDDEAVTVRADLPGFDADEVEVELNDETLSIAATREEEHEAEASAEDDEVAPDDDTDVRYHRRERRRRSVSRRVQIPAAVERDGATASYDDGVLTVTLPKRSSEGAGHSIDVN